MGNAPSAHGLVFPNLLLLAAFHLPKAALLDPSAMRMRQDLQGPWVIYVPFFPGLPGCFENAAFSNAAIHPRPIRILISSASTSAYCEGVKQLEGKGSLGNLGLTGLILCSTLGY